MLAGLVQEGAQVKRGETARAIRSFKEGLDWLLAEAKGGMAIQRYKGLWRDEPEQLWETTMDPTKRILRGCQVEDAISADEIFSTLMGDRRRAAAPVHRDQRAGRVQLDV